MVARTRGSRADGERRRWIQLAKVGGGKPLRGRMSTRSAGAPLLRRCAPSGDIRPRRGCVATTANPRVRLRQDAQSGGRAVAGLLTRVVGLTLASNGTSPEMNAVRAARKREETDRATCWHRSGCEVQPHRDPVRDGTGTTENAGENCGVAGLAEASRTGTRRDGGVHAEPCRRTCGDGMRARDARRSRKPCSGAGRGGARHQDRLSRRRGAGQSIGPQRRPSECPPTYRDLGNSSRALGVPNELDRVAESGRGQHQELASRTLDSPARKVLGEELRQDRAPVGWTAPRRPAEGDRADAGDVRVSHAADRGAERGAEENRRQRPRVQEPADDPGRGPSGLSRVYGLDRRPIALLLGGRARQLHGTGARRGDDGGQAKANQHDQGGPEAGEGSPRPGGVVHVEIAAERPGSGMGTSHRRAKKQTDRHRRSGAQDRDHHVVDVETRHSLPAIDGGSNWASPEFVDTSVKRPWRPPAVRSIASRTPPEWRSRWSSAFASGCRTPRSTPQWQSSPTLASGR